MRKLIVSAFAVMMALASLTGCNKNEVLNSTNPVDLTFVYPVSVTLPANYAAAGVNVSVPDALLSALGTSAEEFTAEYGKTIKFGSATATNSSAITWEAGVNDGKYGHWFDKDGKVIASNGEGALHIQSNCKWGSESSNLLSFNVNMSEAAYTQGAKFKVYQVIGRTSGSNKYTAFIEWNVVVKNELPFATGTASFSMTTGILANIKMIPTKSGEEYTTLEIPMPDAVYAAVKALSPYQYDNLAYFITVGQIKSYAFPKAASIGAEGLDFMFDKTGAIAAESSAVVKTSLYLEGGTPPTGGKIVKLLVKPVVGASVAAGDNFKCGYIFTYGTQKIPLIANITVVSSL